MAEQARNVGHCCRSEFADCDDASGAPVGVAGNAVEESVLVHARPFSVTSKAKQQVEVENVRVVECIRNSEKNHAMTASDF